MKKNIIILSLVFILTSCDAGFRTMGPGEYGVKFVKLPPALGGGINEDIIEPGEKELVWPWEALYKIDTSFQLITWGAPGEGSQESDYVETRAKDGNEVGLSMTIRYHVDPTMVSHVVQKVSSDMDRVKELVTAVARADIRTHMNILNTRDFFSQAKRNQAVQEVREAMNTRLEPEGIIVDAVIYKDHRFERYMGEGLAPDSSYQKQIDETQAKRQETEREEKRRAAIVQQKGKEKEIEQARYNRVVEAAKGHDRQSKLKGDGYLAKKTNEADQIRAAGLNEVEALKKRIEALSGPGGKALLRLEIAKALAKSKPKFVLMNNSKNGSGIGINKVDSNELLNQAGFFSALNEGLKDTGKTTPATPATK